MGEATDLSGLRFGLLALAVVAVLAMGVMAFIDFPPAPAKAPGSSAGRPLGQIMRQPVFVVVPGPDTPHELHKKVVSNIQEIRARGARTLVIAQDGDTDVEPFADEVIRIPHTSPLLQPLLAVVPLQVFALHLSTAKGLDVDQPRNLAKSVTVE